MDQAKGLNYAALKEACKRNIVFFAEQLVYTYDEKAEADAVKRFPPKEYLRRIINKFQEGRKVLIIAKSRQLMISWLAAIFALHRCAFFAHQKVIVLSKTKEDTYQIIDRAKFIYNHLPIGLRNLLPLARKMQDMPMDALLFENKSQLIGLAQGGDKIRSHVASLIILDEFAFQPAIFDTYANCLPCTKRILLISSAYGGFFEEITGIKESFSDAEAAA